MTEEDGRLKFKKLLMVKDRIDDFVHVKRFERLFGNSVIQLIRASPRGIVGIAGRSLLVAAQGKVLQQVSRFLKNFLLRVSHDID